MKILLASSSSGSRGGGELYLIYLGRALTARGHSVTLWASSHPRMDELANTFSSFGEVIRSTYDNTYDRRGRSLASHFNLWGAWRIAREWRRSGAELIHINKQNLEDGLDLLRAARLSRIPSLATIHLTQSARFLGAKLAGARDWVARRALGQYCGFLVTVLENRKRDLLQFLGATPKVRLVNNGVPLFDLSQREALRTNKRAELGFGRDHLLFLAVGRLVPQKRPLYFLEQAERIHRALPQARFLWVGDGTLAADWDREVAARGLGEVVQRLPWQMDIQPYLFAADLLLHVAEFEGLPLAILEALSAALPCILTRHLLLEMPFFDETNSLCLDDSATWLNDIDEPVRLVRLGVSARRLAEREFSYTTMAEHYETLYQVTLRSEA